MNWIKKKGLLLLLILCVLQLAIPAYMIWEQHNILTNGTLYKFQTRPIDPYDPFRGRYVTLRFSANQEAFNVKSKRRLAKDTWVYAILDNDAQGYAAIQQVVVDKPRDGVDFVQVKLAYTWFHKGENNDYHVVLPFDRYYAPESLAPEIEQAVWRRNDNSEVEDVYVAVKVLKGKATIEELFINQLPIREFLQEAQSTE
ncbi:MAG: GDYXXLXY domain-containing protein [Kangiellaceae bacterium]|nr:GDYXXLXY domain-containing protein [Kangiellaceae bacterium]